MKWKMIEDPQDGTPVQYLAVYVLRWKNSLWGEPTHAFVQDDECQEKLEEIYRLATLPADGNEPKEGESDDPMSLLLRIAKIAKELL